ncbi:helix-turn-helix transcriptional regulator [Neoroseomonas rubea]|uniref:helix-turn-helix transcriptional regulator n=1 Tax=Neoroseomonas rubea TaxID=2748666 RepID=UPI0018DF8AB3|nr:AlpA family phage regulatory protein [Roseomonas rubea]
MSKQAPSAITTPAAGAMPSGLRILRGEDVYGKEGRTGCSRSQWYRLIAEGRAPSGFMISPQARGWLEHEIDAWIISRVEKGSLTKAAPAAPVEDPSMVGHNGGPPMRRPRGRPRKNAAPIFGGAA